MGERVDKVLVRRFPGLGRSSASSLIERGLVRVDGARVVKGRRVALGESISIHAEWCGAPSPEPAAPLVVRLERPELVVVDKPAGQVTAPLRGLEAGSLAAALLGRYPEMAGVGYREREPGLLHRLDTRTSGLVVAARSAAAFECLRAALLSELLDKRYLAIVAAANLPDAGSIERALMPHPGASGRVVVAPPGSSGHGARPCRSVFRTLSRHGPWALVEVKAPRAYRHQVRVHLAAAGWPIAGDLDYGGPVSDALPGRHALHASHVAWAGDERLPRFEVDSPLPADLVDFLATATGAAADVITASSS